MAIHTIHVLSRMIASERTTGPILYNAAGEMLAIRARYFGQLSDGQFDRWRKRHPGPIPAGWQFTHIVVDGMDTSPQTDELKALPLVTFGGFNTCHCSIFYGLQELALDMEELNA